MMTAKELMTANVKSCRADTDLASVAKIKKLKGAELDREYINFMVKGHDDELAKSDSLITMANDADLKTMLEDRKTILKRHADAAREIQRGNPQASAQP